MLESVILSIFYFAQGQTMIPYTLISSTSELIDFHRYLKDNKTQKIAIDFEGESNLHAYGEKLCLIQIFDRSNFYIIDPFKLSTNALGNFLEDSSIVKLGYGSDSDSKLLYKQYGIKIKSVYDLQLQVDLLDFKHKGLDSILHELLGITITKKKEYQQYNWMLRPVKEDAIQYALNDVKHLFDLDKKLLSLVLGSDKTEELINKIVMKDIDYDKKSVPTIKKDAQYKMFTNNQRIQFDKLYTFRDEIAKELDLPPNKVIDKQIMFKAIRGNLDLNRLRFNSLVNEKIRNKILEYLGSL
jgi:ribonuclease D